MNFKANGNRVMVELEEVTKTDSGLYIPETAQEGPKWGTVADGGTEYPAGGTMVKSRFTTGDRVLIDTLGATRVRVAGKEYVLVRNEDVIGFEPYRGR